MGFFSLLFSFQQLCPVYPPPFLALDVKWTSTTLTPALDTTSPLAFSAASTAWLSPWRLLVTAAARLPDQQLLLLSTAVNLQQPLEPRTPMQCRRFPLLHTESLSHSTHSRPSRDLISLCPSGHTVALMHRHRQQPQLFQLTFALGSGEGHVHHCTLSSPAADAGAEPAVLQWDAGSSVLAVVRWGCSSGVLEANYPLR